MTAADPSPARLEAACAETGPKVEYTCASPEHLPFDDGQFNYAVLVHQGLTRRRSAGLGALSDGTPPALAEAFRVAASGIIILEWNRFSLPGVPYELCGDEGADGRGKKALAVSPWELWSMLRHFCPERRRQFRSILPLWMWTWPDCGPGEGKGMASALRHALESFPCPSARWLPYGGTRGLGFRTSYACGHASQCGRKTVPGQAPRGIAGQKGRSFCHDSFFQP